MIRSGARRVGRGLKRRIKSLFKKTESSSSWVSAPASPDPPSPLAVATPVSPVSTESVAASEEHAPLTVPQVTALFEDMVRPALQSDGGDIELIKVEDNNVHVRLVGACSTCPSSTVTMKMGIERLLIEEFPQFRQLIQVA